MNKTCHIVGASEFFGEIKKEKDDLIIAADGGYDTLLSLGISPDLVLGDMDSIKSDKQISGALLFPTKKDETDMALAYREGARRGYRAFRIYGGTGGRIDHTFANFALLSEAKREGNNMTLIANGYECFAIENEELRIFGEVGKKISVFAFGKEALGVSLFGLEYPLRDYSLSPNSHIGVSNEFKEKAALISVKDGLLLIMKEI